MGGRHTHPGATSVALQPVLTFLIVVVVSVIDGGWGGWLVAACLVSIVQQPSPSSHFVSKQAQPLISPDTGPDCATRACLSEPSSVSAR